jgi:hypothetical protein
MSTSATQASGNQNEPGTAFNAIHQTNDSALPSLNSYQNFIPTGSDGPSTVYTEQRDWGQGLSAVGTVSSSVVDDSQNATRRVRGAKVEEGDGEQHLTDGFEHGPAFQESPYYFYVQKPGSDGSIFTPYIKPVDTSKRGRAIPLQSIRYNDYFLKEQVPPMSWRLGITAADVATGPAEQDIGRLSTPQINALGLDVRHEG